MLVRLVDLLKSRSITALFTSLTSGGGPVEQTEVGISSLIDTWLLLRNLEQGSERTRALYILKARGMAHSNRVREFVLTDDGVDLLDVYAGPAGILTGSARVFQEMQERVAELARRQDAERRRLVIGRKRKALEARIAELQAEFEAELQEAERAIAEAELGAKAQLAGRVEVAREPGAAAKPRSTRKGGRR
jgi:circadian clock protein KaiC